MSQAVASSNVVPLRPVPAEKPLPRLNEDKRDVVWDTIEEVLGYGPLTVSEKALWAKQSDSLRLACATPETIRAVAYWYHKHWPNIDLTITALEKWYSHFLRMHLDRQKKRGAVCPDCGLGGNQHLEDCVSLSK